MEKRIYPEPIESVVSPEPVGRRSFTDAAEAVAALRALYDRNTEFLRDSFAALAEGADPNRRYRAFYPEVGLQTLSYTQIDSRQAYGHMPTPGHYSTTITRPDLFESYLTEQLRLLMRNHGVPITVSESRTPIPVQFAFLEGTHVDGSVADRLQRPIRDLFDVPDLDGTDDHIANGTFHDYAQANGIGQFRIDLAPGDLYFFNTHCIHEIPPLDGTDPRIVLAVFIGYSPEDKEIFVWS